MTPSCKSPILRKSVKKYSILIFQKSADVRIFAEIQAIAKIYFFPVGPNLEQKPLYLVGTVLKGWGIQLITVMLIVKIEESVISLDYSGYHKNRIQLLFYYAFFM